MKEPSLSVELILRIIYNDQYSAYKGPCGLCIQDQFSLEFETSLAPFRLDKTSW